MNYLKKIKNMFGKEITMADGRKAVCNVVAMLENQKTGKVRLIPGANLVTTAGDTYYAKKAVGESPAFSVAGLRLGTSSTAPTKSDTDVTTHLTGGDKATDGTYPKTNDGDTDNTGAGVNIATWRVSYTTSEANGSGIYEGALVDNISIPTTALTHFVFGAAFTKTSSDTLKVFVNHTFLGT